jgi:hypothetical protein
LGETGRGLGGAGLTQHLACLTCSWQMEQQEC